MNVSDIEARQADVSKQFDDLQARGNDLRQQVEAIEGQLKQLQGKFQALEELKQDMAKADKTTKPKKEAANAAV